MKKCTKILLAGAGMVAVGWIAYELMRKPKEAATTVNEMNETTDHIQTTGSPASTSTQELIERRKGEPQKTCPKNGSAGTGICGGGR